MFDVNLLATCNPILNADDIIVFGVPYTISKCSQFILSRYGSGITSSIFFNSLYFISISSVSKYGFNADDIFIGNNLDDGQLKNKG